MAKVNNNNKLSLGDQVLPPLPDINTLSPLPITGSVATQVQPQPRLLNDLSPQITSRTDLLNAVQNNLNLGSKDLQNLYQSYSKNDILDGLQNGKNFGNRQISLLPNESLKNAVDNNPFSNNSHLLGKGVSGINAGLTQAPVQTQDSFVTNQRQNPFKVILNGLNTPVGRGLLMAGVVGATGGGALPALTYGFSTGAQNHRLRQEDATNRAFLTQQGIDTSQYQGYLSNDALKNYVDNYTKFDNLNIKREQMQLRSALQGAKDNTARAKIIMDAFNKGSITAESAKAQLEMYGITNADLQASNDTRITNARVPNIQADTDYTIQKTDESKYLTPLKGKKLIRDTNKPYFKPSSGNTKVENMDGYGEALSQYIGITDPKQKAYARQTFIKHFNIDPEKKIQQPKSNKVSLPNLDRY